jgi:hypothetical protein
MVFFRNLNSGNAGARAWTRWLEADGDVTERRSNEPLTAGPRALEGADRWLARFISRRKKEMKPET